MVVFVYIVALVILIVYGQNNRNNMRLFGIGDNKTHYNVLKFYKIVDIDEARKISIHKIVSHSLGLTFKVNSSYPSSYEINFGKKQWRSKKRFDIAISKIKREDIYHFTAMFSESKSSIHYVNNILNIVPSSVPMKSMISVEIAIPKLSTDYDKLMSFLGSLYNIFQYDYGYVVELSEDYHFGTERKIKKKLFGQEITIEEIDNIWRFHSVGINYGFLKDIYQINIFNKTQISQPIVEKCLKEKIGKLEQINDDVSSWVLSNDELSQVKDFFNESKYLVANKQSVRYFLDSDESKQFHALMEFR